MGDAAPPARTDTLQTDLLQTTGDRITTLLEASAAGGVVARERAEELVRLVADLYGAGLARVLAILDERGRLDQPLVAALADDQLVSGLLLVHDLHPYDVTTRVEQALERVRPYLGSHGGDVELLGVTDDVVRLRMLGSCDGCASSSVTLTLAVEGAIEAAAPEIVGIEVEPAAGSTAAVSAGPVITIDSLWSHVSDAPRASGPGGSWEPVPQLTELAEGTVAGFLVGELAILACRVGTDLFAYVDRCGRCRESLAGATLGRRLGGATGDVLLGCPRCGAHFEVRRAGTCVEETELHLDPLPLLVDGGVATVAVPDPTPA